MEAFQLRLWDGRIGRWLSPDPYGEFDSPYLGMGNNPISNIDPDGGSTQCEGCPGKGTTNDPYQLQEVVIRGTPKPSTLATVVDVGTDFLPFSGIKDVYRGYQSGNGWQMAMGIGFIAFDVATLGSGSLIKGGLKAAIKVGEKQIVKEIAEEAVEIEGKHLLLTAGKKTLHKHHILPREFKKWFAERGIKNIDDYTVKLSQRTHLSDVHNGAGQWNKKWQAFIESNPSASPNEIFHQAENMLNELGIQHLPYVKYR